MKFQGRDCFRAVVTLILAGIFAATVTRSVQKLLEAKVSTEESIANAQELLYPSVTACAQRMSGTLKEDPLFSLSQ